MSALIYEASTERERVQDRRRQIRDRILMTLEDAGRAMSPGDLAARTGLGIAAVTIAALRSPSYFTATTSRKRVVMIDRHPHLKIGIA